MRHSRYASPFTSLENENMRKFSRDDYLSWFMSSYIWDTKGRYKKTTTQILGDR